MSEMRQCDYDIIADSYDELRGASSDYLMYWTAQLAENAKLKDSDSIIDLGCGTGRYTEAFALMGRRTVIGLDMFRKMLKRATAKYSDSRINWIQANCRNIPLKEGMFDIALMILVLHHIPLKDRFDVYKEIQSILKPGGRFVLMTRSHEQIRESLIALFPGVEEIDVQRMPDIDLLKYELKRAGFSMIKTIELPNYSLYRNRSEFTKKVEGKYISTLTMFQGAEFQRRFDKFKERLDERFGDKEQLYDPMGFTFVVAKK